MNKKTVCHISTVHSMYDDRVFYKECVSLVEKGYEVFFVVRNKSSETINGVKVVALPEYKSRPERFIKGGFKSLRLAMRTRAGICHFHDPELIWIGVLLRIFGRKVVYDVHENYSQQILYKEWISCKWVRKLVSVFFYVYEEFANLFFNAVVTVTEDIQSRFPKKKSFLVRNFPVIPDLARCKPVERPSDKTILIYAGGLLRVRGIKELVTSLQYLDDSVVLWLIGSFDDDEYYKECCALDSWQKVVYHGYKRHDEVYNYLISADIGVSLLYPIKNYLTSLPVKVFEYMVLKKPVVMSDFEYWKKYFAACAVFSDPTDPKMIAECIHELICDNAKMEKMGNAGYDMICKHYSWNKEKEELFRIYKRLEQ